MKLEVVDMLIGSFEDQLSEEDFDFEAEGLESIGKRHSSHRVAEPVVC